MKIIRKLLLRIVVAFFASTILAVVAFRFLPVYITPYMVVQQAKQSSWTLHHQWVPMTEISHHMPIAVMASEDQRFMEHHGFDFDAIQQAAKHNREHPEKNVHGASTISQQTAKNVFLWPGRSWLRKGLEAYFTVLIELCWSKERILEVYLNSIETGPDLYGVETVARRHFAKAASELTADQCALIAATLPNPRHFSSASPSKYVKKRQRQIRRQMSYVEQHLRK